MQSDQEHHEWREREATDHLIAPKAAVRAGWAEAAERFGPNGLLDAPTATRFDDEAWEW